MYTLLLLIKYRKFVIPARSPSNVKKIYFNYKVEKVVKFEQKIDKINNIEFIYLKKGQKIYL